MKRDLETLATTLQTLFSLHAEEFFIQHPNLKEDLQSYVEAIDEAWQKGEPEAVGIAHSEPSKLLESSNFIKKLNVRKMKNQAQFSNLLDNFCIWCSLFYCSSKLLELLIGT